LKDIEFFKGDPGSIKRSLMPLGGVSETLADVEDRLRRFYDSAPEGVLHVNESGIILDVNSSLLQRLGYGKAELVGRPMWTIHPPREQGRVRALFEEAKRTGKVSARVAQKPRKGVSLRMDMTLQVLDCRAGKVIQETVQRVPPEEKVRGYGRLSRRRRRRVRILLLDGEKGLTCNYEAFLKGLGYLVEAAETRRGGLRRFKDTFFNIAVVNAQLLDGDDAEVLEEMGGDIPRTRMVIISENPTVKDVIVALNEGVDAYLTIPFEESQLGRVIEEQLEAQAEELVINEEKVAEYIMGRVKQLG